MARPPEEPLAQIAKNFGRCKSSPHRWPEIADFEAYLVESLRSTHPVRIGGVLRRIEAEVWSTYPADEAARLLQRAIVVAVNQPDRCIWDGLREEPRAE
ncbi:hypothetical protein ABZX66_18490 [Micromonospora aurantiaca]|uniref:hypothetical protein n=1 Tax=Micromonospora aurantiaca (nom. illeg.) TaxID=47850 RepID=UPI0033B2FFB5